MAPTQPVVLVVDDEPSVADTYALRLQERYEARTAYGGREALLAVEDGVDAVVLDRRMPGMHGDEVLATLRERGFDGPVMMVTAVDPDLNILELDFDDYLCKPVDQETLVGALDRLLPAGTGQDDRLEEFFELRAKLEVLKEERAAGRLEESGAVADLRERVDRLGAQLREEVEDFEALAETHRSVERG